MLPLHLLLRKERSLSLNLGIVSELSTLSRTETSLTQSQETMCRELTILNFLTTGFPLTSEAKSKRLSLKLLYLQLNKALTRFTLRSAPKAIH